ncbi:hypothetical protein Droror1_Dr00015677 [Drosera rotundifolia]
MILMLIILDLPTLTAYVSYARSNIHPQLSDEAAEDLTRGYVEMRRRGNFPGSSKKDPRCCNSRSLNKRCWRHYLKSADTCPAKGNNSDYVAEWEGVK